MTEPHRAAGPARTPFNALRASGAIEHGMLRDDELHPESGVSRAQDSGTLGLLTEALKFRIVASKAAVQRVNGKLQLKGVDVRKRLDGKLQDLLAHRRFSDLMVQ